MNQFNNKDTSAGIFEPIFEVRVPQEALRSEEEIRLYGTPTTGNRRIDKALRSAKTTTYMNIARMATLHSQGWEVAVVKHEDCKVIYDYVQNHLDAWVKLLSSSVNRPNAPYEDLHILDQFAQSVFAHARHLYANPDNMDNSFMRQIEELGLLGEFSIFQPSIQARERAQAAARGEVYEPAQRAPLGDFFTAAMLGKRTLP